MTLYIVLLKVLYMAPFVNQESVAASKTEDAKSGEMSRAWAIRKLTYDRQKQSDLNN
jgi:hypothetical protein